MRSGCTTGERFVVTRYVSHSFRYHLHHRQSRLVLCGCAPSFRIGDRVCWCSGKRNRRGWAGRPKY